MKQHQTFPFTRIFLITVLTFLSFHNHALAQDKSARTEANNLSDNITLEWVSHYASGLLESIDITTASICDSAGNVYITGYSGSYAGADLIGVDYLTVKYDASGNQIWTARYSGPGIFSDEAHAIAVDGSGNVYVTGSSGGYTTIKYNSEGIEEWVARYDEPGSSFDVAHAIAVDGSGNIYVTGSNGSNTSSDYSTIKYNSEGVEVWVARYNGPGESYDMAKAIAVDDSGNIYITGGSEGSDTGLDYATVKYTPEGVEEWAARYNGSGNDYDFANAIAVDDSGNIYVIGDSKGSDTSFDYAIIKYNSDGVQEWTARYNGPVNSSDYAHAIALDGSGNIYVTGSSATIKYNTEGIEEWVARYDEPGSSFDEANAIAVDSLGNIYVTGNSHGDYATIKYNSEGVEEWVASYNGPGNASDVANAIGVDGLGNVYVTGRSKASDTNTDYATVKYDSEGVEVWVARHDGRGNSSDYAHAIAVDGSGNVYVTGSNGSNTNSDYATVKYNSEGVEEWAARYNGSGNDYDWANAIVVDGSGNIYVTGNSKGSDTSFDYATIKYNSDGVEEWVARYNGPVNASDYANAIALDGSGNVYVTGNSEGSNTGHDYATVKYNAEGVEEWAARYNAPGNDYDRANAIAVDGLGNIYVTGYSHGVYADYATIKYSSEGVEEWVARYNGSRNLNDRANDIAVDGLGNIYVTGYSYGTINDYATIKYNPEGVEEWVARYNGSGNDDDEAHAIAVDNSGNIYVTGYSKDSNTGDNCVTIKYNSQGAEEWIVKYNGPGNGDDEANAIAADNFGNIYVTGGSLGSGTLTDYATIKYNSQGAEEWVARYNGPVNASDYANAIAVDGSGNVYVTGTSQDSRGSIYTTIKYSQGTVNIENDNQIKTYKYHLSQNYPNPFNPMTTLSYSIPEAGIITLKVYDTLGSEVVTLVNEYQSVGDYQVDFYSNKLSGGIYFYQIISNNFVETKKMILLK